MARSARAEDLAREPAASPELSKDDERILQRGEISKGRYISGGVTGTVVGFGIGHAIQGRYRDIGWVFTAGESASVTLLFAGVLSCFGDQVPGSSCTPSPVLMGGGVIGLLGFHIWEIVDLWVAPPKINARYRELHASSHHHDALEDIKIYPTLVERSPGLGLSLTF